MNWNVKNKSFAERKKEEWELRRSILEAELAKKRNFNFQKRGQEDKHSMN